MEIHTRKAAENVRKKTIRMADLVKEAVGSASGAFLDFDPQKAREVVEKDDEINTIEMEIDKAIFECLALKAPVAGDLRLLFSMQKVNKDLERIGDHAVNIAQAAIKCCSYEKPVSSPDIKVMVSITRHMLADAITCFIEEDIHRALKVLERDDQVDELNHHMKREVIDLTKKDTASIEVAIELLRVSSNLERIADLTTNIAEDVIFQAKARDIKHHHMENLDQAIPES